MKKSVIALALFLLVFTFALTNVLALTETQQIDKAYECLQTKVDAKGCSGLTTEQLIFTVLATGNCRNEFLADSHNLECWPGGNCGVELTAKALLVLDKLGEDKTAAQDWLLSKTATSTDLNWFLEIDSVNTVAMQCEIYYDGTLTKTVNMGKDKKFDSNAGSCLTLANNNYWYKIDKSCYNKEFGIKCSEDFLGTLLFQKEGSKTYHVTDNLVSSQATGTELLKVSSKCFADRDSQCNYVGSLWAATMLHATSGGSTDIINEAKKFRSYLIAGLEDNGQYLPEAFLFMLTENSGYKAALMLKQFGDKYWDYFGGKYYSTPLATLPFIGRALQEREGAISWLLETQQPDGCWDAGNIRNNAFILWTMFPRNINLAQYECLDEGFICKAENSTCSGTVKNLGCAGTDFCCDTTIVITEEDTCTPRGVNFDCVSDEQTCIGDSGTINNTLSCLNGEICCNIEPSEQNTCNPLDGFTCVTDSGICSFFGGTVDSSLVCDNNYVCCDINQEVNECTSNGNYCVPFGSSCNNIQDYDCSAGNFCCGEEVITNGCTQNGFECVANGASCSDVKTGYTCDVGEFCCNPEIAGQTCGSQGYECLSIGAPCSNSKTQFTCAEGTFCCDLEPTPNLCENNGYTCIESPVLCGGSIINGLPCGDSSNYCCIGEVYNKVDTCTPVGYSCVADGQTCTNQEGEVETGFDCLQGKVCCNVPEEADTCTPEGYTCLEEGSTCDGLVLTDPFSCPQSGVCCFEGYTNETVLCTAQGDDCVENATQCDGLIFDQFVCLGNQVCCSMDVIEDDTCEEAGFSCVDATSCSSPLGGYECSGTKVCCESGDDSYSCEEANYECKSQTSCSSLNGRIVNSYSCEGALKCCDVPESQNTCAEENGVVCTSSQICSGGDKLNTAGLSYGQTCCISGGTCEDKIDPIIPPTTKSCIDNFGVCEEFSCGDGYERSYEYDCEDPLDTCCVESETTKGGSYWWVWLLFFLVILVVVGIIYRDKLKEYYQKLQVKMSKGKDSPGTNRNLPPRFPPRGFPQRTLSSGYNRSIQTSPPQPRKIIPMQNSPVPQKTPLGQRPIPPRPSQNQKPIPQKPQIPKKKSPEELNEVLKKLKEMGK